MGFRGALVILYSIALWYAGKLLLAWEHPFALFWSFYMIYAAAAHCCIGVAMCLGFTQLAGKDSKTGSVAHWAKLVMFPFRVSTFIFLFIQRYVAFAEQSVVSKINDTTFLAGYPNDTDFLPSAIVNGNFVMVDCTCELPKVVPCKYYYNVQLWDGYAASVAQLNRVCEFVCEIRKKEPTLPLLVHCAFGKGRSCQVLCALRVALGEFATWREAYEDIQKKRPIVYLNPWVFQSKLDLWEKQA